MPGLDDAGMNRADRDLMQALAFRGEEIVGGVARNAEGSCAERKLYVPEAEIEPGAHVGRADGTSP